MSHPDPRRTYEEDQEAWERKEAKMKPQHTPTPWKFNKKENAIIATSPEGAEFFVARNNLGGPFVEANLEFIVRAVNSHDALLEAAKEAQCAIHAFAKNLKLEKDGSVGSVFEKLSKAIQQAEQ